MVEPKGAFDISINPLDSSSEDRSNAVVNAVFFDWATRNADIKKKDLEALLIKKAPTFKDAMMRGWDPVFAKLSGEGIPEDTMNGAAKWVYKMDNGVLMRRLVPKGDDPLEQLAFIKRVRANGTPTFMEDDITTNYFLIDEIAIEGSRAQEYVHTQARNIISRINYIPNILLRYFPITYSRLKEVKEVIGDLQDKDDFLERFIANQSMQRLLDEAALDIDQIGIFQKLATPKAILIATNTPDRLSEEQIAASGDRRLSIAAATEKTVRLFNTLALELLTNPEIFTKPDNILKPVTTIERIARAKSVFDKLQHEDPAKRNEDVYILALTTSSRLKSRMTPLFAKLGLTEDVTGEFINALVANFLHDMPGHNNIEVAQNGEQTKIEAEFGLNRKFILDKPIKLPPKLAEQKSRYTPKTIIDINGFVGKLFEKGHFRPNEFVEFTPEQKSQILANILEKASKSSVKECIKVINLVMNYLNISCSVHSGQSLVHFNINKLDKTGNFGFRISGETFIKGFLDKIQAGDLNIITALDAILMRVAIKRYLGSHYKSTRLETFMQKARFSGADREQSIEDGKSNIAAYILLGYHEQLGIGPSRDSLFAEILEQTIEETRSVERIMNLKPMKIDVNEVRSDVKKIMDAITSQAALEFISVQYADNELSHSKTGDVPFRESSSANKQAAIEEVLNRSIN